VNVSHAGTPVIMWVPRPMTTPEDRACSHIVSHSHSRQAAGVPGCAGTRPVPQAARRPRQHRRPPEGDAADGTRWGSAVTSCAGSIGHQAKPPCVACWPASTPTRWTWPSAAGWPTSSHCHRPPDRHCHRPPDGHRDRRGGRRSRSTARPSAAAATTKPAVIDHTSRGVLAQTDVDTKTNEIARFQPLLEGLDLARRVRRNARDATRVLPLLGITSP
jgi:hypothetical protein